MHEIAQTPRLNAGMTYEQMTVGLRFRTTARTLTEADLIALVALTGFNELLFLDER